jgi:hypothetical protein
VQHWLSISRPHLSHSDLHHLPCNVPGSADLTRQPYRVSKTEHYVGWGKSKTLENRRDLRNTTAQSRDNTSRIEAFKYLSAPSPHSQQTSATHASLWKTRKRLSSYLLPASPQTLRYSPITHLPTLSGDVFNPAVACYSAQSHGACKLRLEPCANPATIPLIPDLVCLLSPYWDLTTTHRIIYLPSRRFPIPTTPET